MANKIVMELGPDSISRAVRLVRKHERQTKNKARELMDRLSEIGLGEARVRFEEGARDGNVPPIGVVTVKTNTGFKIIAFGTDVYFIEFGAGNAAGNHPDAKNVKMDVSSGSYSRINTGEYAKYGSWHYQKTKYTELPEYMPMYHAAREIERQVKQIAKEVFDK